MQNKVDKRVIAFRLLGIGWHIAFSLIVFTLLGYWLDSHFDTSFPVFSLVGVTVGLGVAMGGLYLMIRPLMKEFDNNTSKEDN